MARASWGNVGVDYSSFFSDLYKSAENKKKEDQRALDQDAISRWTTGQMSDAEWLGYIASRIAATADDPAEHQYWLAREREDSRSIGDTHAQSAFEETGNYDDYIAYQEGVLASLAPGSQAYVDRQKLIYDLTDQRDAESVTDEVAAIQKRIDAGDATAYKDMVKVWEKAKATARPNSTNLKTIEANLETARANLKTQQADGELGKIEADFLAGKLSGKQAALKIRAVAGKYYKGDQTQYYKVYNSSYDYQKYGNNRMDPNTGKIGGSGSGGGTGPGSKTAVKLREAQIDFDLDVQKKIAKASPRDPYINVGGEQIRVYNPDGSMTAEVQEFQASVLPHFDLLAKEQEASNDPLVREKARDTRTAKADFITDAIQPANSIVAGREVGQLVNLYQSDIAAAGASNDPHAITNTNAEWVRRLERYQRNIQTFDNRQNIGDAKSEGKRVPEATPLPDVMQTDRIHRDKVNVLIGYIKAAGSGSADLATIEEQLDRTFEVGGKDSFLTKSIRDTAKTVSGAAQDILKINNQQAIFVMTPRGVRTVDAETGFKTDPATGQIVEALVGNKADMAKIRSEYGGTDWMDVSVEQNGTLVTMPSVVKPFSPGRAYVAQKKIVVTDKGGETIATIPAGSYIPTTYVNDGRAAGWARQGLAVLDDVQFTDWLVTTTAGSIDGSKSYKTNDWLIDKRTGAAIPLDYGMRLLNIPTNGVGTDATIRIGDDFSPGQITTKPGISGIAGPGVFAGSDPKLMAEDILRNPGKYAGVMTYDQNGNPTPKAGSWAIFFDPPTGTMPNQRDSYWQEKNRGSLPGDRDSSWLDEATAEQRIADAKKRALVVSQTEERRNEDPVAGFTKLAGDLGIKIGRDFPSGGRRGIQREGAGLPATLGAPKQPTAPLPELPAVYGTTSSGPAVTGGTGKTIGTLSRQTPNTGRIRLPAPEQADKPVVTPRITLPKPTKDKPTVLALKRGAAPRERL